jgi:hypothetical protein
VACLFQQAKSQIKNFQEICAGVWLSSCWIDGNFVEMAAKIVSFDLARPPHDVLDKSKQSPDGIPSSNANNLQVNWLVSLDQKARIGYCCMIFNIDGRWEFLESSGSLNIPARKDDLVWSLHLSSSSYFPPEILNRAQKAAERQDSMTDNGIRQCPRLRLNEGSPIRSDNSDTLCERVTSDERR